MRQRQALRVMLEGHSVFLTGPPGAGKTYVLNEFIKRAQRAGKTIAVTASTGIAATHIGGTTIHSWSGLGVRDSLSDWDRERLEATERLVKRYNGADILVIDEVSMLHGARLDMVNEVCKLLRRNDKPFGGLQVILVGDLFQLPPVNRGGELVDFAHTSKAWQELNPKICYITEQHRQEQDGLLDMLNSMRRGDVNELHEEMLRERLGQKPDASIAVTRLYTHNADVEKINQQHLSAIDSDAKTFIMQTKGPMPKVETLKKGILAPEFLELKKGAEVMFVANNYQQGFANGSRGKVVDFKAGQPVVELVGSGRTIQVEPHSWLMEEDGRKIAEAAQLPLRLAWAITIHKSQGMSLDAAEIDLSRSFTPGMGYVALSRVRSLDGVFLGGINNLALAMHPTIFEYDIELRNASEELASSVEDMPEADTENVNSATGNGGETSAEPDTNIDQGLLSDLKRWRTERARIEKVAPFIVAHDKHLEAIATRPPTSAMALLGIPGFGPKKLETYGEDILKIVSKYAKPEDREEPATAAVGPKPTATWTRDKDEQLIDYFTSGTPLDEVCKALQCTTDEAWRRLHQIISRA